MVNKSKTKPMYGIGIKKDGKAAKKSRKLSMSKRLAIIQKGGDDDILCPYINPSVTYAIPLLYEDNITGLSFVKGKDSTKKELKLSNKLSDYKDKFDLLWGTSIGNNNTFEKVTIYPGEQIKKKRGTVEIITYGYMYKYVCLCV